MASPISGESRSVLVEEPARDLGVLAATRSACGVNSTIRAAAERDVQPPRRGVSASALLPASCRPQRPGAYPGRTGRTPAVLGIQRGALPQLALSPYRSRRHRSPPLPLRFSIPR